MSWTQKELDVCQEAFYLLRQDIDVPTVSMADSDTTPEWKKCKAAFAHAKAEVLASHEWTWAANGAGESLANWPDGAVNALIYCVARELAIPIAGRIADMQNLDALYRDKLAKARTKDLSEGIDAICDNFTIPFVFGTTGENSDVTQRTSTLCRFQLGSSMLTKVDNRVSAITVRVHNSVTDQNDYQLVLFKKSGDTQTLIACSKNTQKPYPAHSMVTWHFDDVEVPVGHLLVCQFVTGLNTLESLRALYENDELVPVYTFKAQLSPTIQTTEFSADSANYAYTDGGGTRTGICPAVRVYNYSQGAASLYSTAQKVMRRVFPFIATGDGASLPFSVTAFANSVNEATSTAESEVKRTCGVIGLDAMLEGAAECLAISRVAPVLGLDKEFAQLKLQEYSAKIQEWRKLELNASLTSNSDPILAQLIANFKSDDAGLANAYEMYTNRAAAVKATAYGEIERVHNWQWIGSSWNAQTPLETKLAAMDGLTRSAFVSLVVKQLAASCGFPPEMVQVYEAQYQSRLRAARIADLETTSITDPVQHEVLALIRDTFEGQKELPRDMKAITDKIDRLKEMARKDVLAAHDWSFAEADMGCDTVETDSPDPMFRFRIALPKNCLLVSACYGEGGKVAQWKLRGREVHASERIVRVVYIKDVEDFAAWHPKAYRAFILRLAADVAKGVASNPKDRSFQEQLYRDALEEAKACDARSANTPDEAYGDNELADRMLYGERSRHFDGLFED